MTGRILAESLSTVLSDLDDITEEIFFREEDERLSSRKIYRRDPELFQSFELKAAVELSSSSVPIIAAAGGGICDNTAAVDRLKNSFIFVYIEEDAEVLYKRIIKGGIPAFLSEDQPLEDFISLYKTRTEKYDRLCNIKITAAGRTAEAISRELLQMLRRDGYAG